LTAAPPVLPLSRRDILFTDRMLRTYCEPSNSLPDGGRRH
jgi:hypothetical protein